MSETGDPIGDFDLSRASGGGQVGAPCGCIGCFDPNTCGSGHDACVQGNWEYSRKKKQGSLKATDFNSLVCGCEFCTDGLSTPVDSFDGNTCTAAQTGCGPDPRPAPANLVCFSGTGLWSETGGKRTEPVVFRVEAEDHGEPGTSDEYRIWIYRLRNGETIKGLALDICCRNPDTDVAHPDLEQFGAGRAADIFDGGVLIHGNIQIHPQIAAHVGMCPLPADSCPAPAP